MDRPTSARAFAIDLTAEPPMRVGAASIDPVSREAIFGDQRERLQPQNLKVLLVLARHRGAVVTREELIEQCWNGRFVGDDVINRSISLLRAFAARSGGFTIETVPKAGYRLVEHGQAAASTQGPRRRWPLLVAAFGVVLALVGATAWQWRESGKHGRPSVALLRFTSGPENDTRELAAAGGDALSNMLLDGSFPPKLDWPATSAQTNADDFVLGGDVRKIDEGFAATVQLRDRRSGVLIFSRTYRASGAQVPLLPERIGAEISSNLNGALAMLVLGGGHPIRPDISADMLKQIGLTVSGEDPLAAYGIARHLVDRAPDQPQSQLALAFDTGFALGGLPRNQRAEAAARGRIAAERAQQLAGDFGDSYVP